MMSFLFFNCFFSEKEKGGTLTGLIHSFPPRTMSSHDAPKTTQLRWHSHSERARRMESNWEPSRGKREHDKRPSSSSRGRH